MYSKKEEILPIIKRYLETCDWWRMPTKAGLRIALGFTRETYREYKEKEEFVDTIKGVENFIEECWTQQLTNQSAAGTIFYLKNAFKEDFKDRQEVEHSGALTISEVLAKLRENKNAKDTKKNK